MTQTDFSIGDASSMSGASQKQIRNWEARGHIPTADRIVYGSRSFRRFTLEQVLLITRIRELVDQGYTLPAAAEMAKTENLSKRKESRPGGSK